jgi:asparagine synthase (glutamine-hydrolysing)
MIRRLARQFPSAHNGFGALEKEMRRHYFDPENATTSSDASEETAIDSLGPITAALYRSFHRYSLPRILRNFDVHSMAHGVESRMPLLDWRVACFAFSVPDESKIARGYTKLLLREAMNGVLPEPVRLRRHKLGYTAPVANWLGGLLGDWVWDEVNHEEFLRSELWDGQGLLNLTRKKRQSGEPWQLAEAHRVLLAVTANWWRTRWIRSAERRPSGTRAAM